MLQADHGHVGRVGLTECNGVVIPSPGYSDIALAVQKGHLQGRVVGAHVTHSALPAPRRAAEATICPHKSRGPIHYHIPGKQTAPAAR